MTREGVDPELWPLLDSFPTLDLSPETLPVLRAASVQAELPKSEYDAAVSVSEHWCPRPDGEDPVRVLVYRPRTVNSSSPLYFHMHGGGFILYSPEIAHARNMEIAARNCCVVASVDYTLAPEARYPVQLEQCHDTLRWLLASCDQFGIDPAAVVIAGESAGGGLAAALALKLRDTKLVRPIFQMLQCPMLDDRTCTQDLPEHIGAFIWSRKANAFGWEALLGAPPGSQGISAFAAPARVDHLDGLPATFLVTGALDLFAMEDMDYARRLILAGVPTELHVYPGAFHGFARATEARVSKAYFRDADAALARALEKR